MRSLGLCTGIAVSRLHCRLDDVLPSSCPLRSLRRPRLHEVHRGHAGFRQLAGQALRTAGSGVSGFHGRPRPNTLLGLLHTDSELSLPGPRRARPVSPSPRGAAAEAPPSSQIAGAGGFEGTATERIPTQEPQFEATAGSAALAPFTMSAWMCATPNTLAACFVESSCIERSDASHVHQSLNTASTQS